MKKMNGILFRLLLVSIVFGSVVTCCYGQQSKTHNIRTYFPVPENYERVFKDAYSEWLIEHPLKNFNRVKYFNGRVKHNDGIYAAVFDYEIGDRDLHQCADAAIYLRASYNYASKFQDRLGFHFTNGDQAWYLDYLNGATYVPINNGADIEVVWNKPRKDNCKTFRRWLDAVWTYAGTWSVEKYDTEPVSILEIQPGDVFIQGGFPGHAVTVVDVAVNDRGHRIFMLAQSYMPAQEQHVLINPAIGDVWYSADNMSFIITPEWTFEPTDLRRFKK